jgi:hypothetical protein
MCVNSYVKCFRHACELVYACLFDTQESIGLRNVLIWLHQMDSSSLLMDLFARAELVPAYSLTF